MNTLAERVRFAREKKGLRLVDVDKAAELRAGHCGLIEHGDRENPSIETVRKLAGALDVTIDWLATGKHPADQTGPQQVVTASDAEDIKRAAGS